MSSITAPLAPRPHIRPITLLGLGICVAALIAALVVALLAVVSAASRPFSPQTADGLIASGAAVSVTDEHLPAINRLEPALLQALQDASVAASAAGVVVDVTSGWRSVAYQEWLWSEAVDTFGDRETASRFVASPDSSAHVRGAAVDIGSLEGQIWLRDEGRAWGLCQTYGNEPWHFERATEPGGQCPPVLPDATAPRDVR